MSRFEKENPKEFRSNNLCSKKTKQVTSYAVRIINNFLNDRGNERSWLNLSKEELASTPTSAQKTVSFTKQIICSGRHSTDISRSGKMFDVLFFRSQYKKKEIGRTYCCSQISVNENEYAEHTHKEYYPRLDKNVGF